MAPSRLQVRYFEQGLRILADDGPSGLKIVPLCSSLSVTTGSFYHSFSSWKEYTNQLLEHWRRERTTRLVEAARTTDDPVERLEALVGMAVSLPHRAEAAIRAWSLSDPNVAAVQRTVDQERYDVIRPAFMSLVGDPDLADRYARSGLYALIGYEQAGAMQDEQTLVWSLRQILASALSGR